MMNILVLDDEPIVASTVKTALEAAGFMVRTSMTADEARQAITAELPELLILDLKLQEDDGLSVLRWVRSHHPGLPVVVLTGFDEQEVSAKVRQLGVAEVIEKPLTIPEIQQRIGAIAAKLGKAPQEQP